MLHFNCAGIKEITWRKTDKTKWKSVTCINHKTSDSGDAIPAQEMRRVNVSRKE